ncbi:unnamed protein product [Sphenostylis stenocarpa]|uniref:Uncharacterized protein n=1 Tax=Sphenostylis stenocarpa TaxID=92480 RepID=A0AA86SWW2_9FABA|nr:unnamed protein product [Sphenostylis stenocarpa]
MDQEIYLLEYWVTRYSVQSPLIVSIVDRQHTERMFRLTRVPPLLLLVPVSLALFLPDMHAMPSHAEKTSEVIGFRTYSDDS